MTRTTLEHIRNARRELQAAERELQVGEENDQQRLTRLREWPVTPDGEGQGFSPSTDTAAAPPRRGGLVDVDPIIVPDVPLEGGVDAVIWPDGRWRDVVRGIDSKPSGGDHPLRSVVSALYRPDFHSSLRPLTVLAHPGAYTQGGPLFIGGGWSPGSPNTVAVPGKPLCLAVRSLPSATGERAEFNAITIMDKLCSVDMLRLQEVDVRNIEYTAAPIMMVCGSQYSTGDLQLTGVRLLPSFARTGYGGAGGKWGAHWSHGSRSLVCVDVTTPGWSPEEHDHYGKSRQGPIQYRAIRADGGNRTWGHFTGYAEDPSPGGSLLLQDLVIENQGQSWGALYNGGSSVTLWWNPNYPEVLRRVRVRDSKYGACAITAQPGAKLHERYLGLWHHRHVIFENCEFDNRSSEPGEKNGDREAWSLTAAHTIEFRGKTVVRGILGLDSRWAAMNVVGSNPVGRFLWRGDAEIELHGALQRFNRESGQIETLLPEPAAGKPHRIDSTSPFFRGSLD